MKSRLEELQLQEHHRKLPWKSKAHEFFSWASSRFQLSTRDQRALLEEVRSLFNSGSRLPTSFVEIESEEKRVLKDKNFHWNIAIR